MSDQFAVDKNSILSIKESGGFWIPNSFVDLHAQALKPRGVFLYVLLCRATTQTQYPDTADLAELAGISEARVDAILEQLYTRGLLTDTDLWHIRR